MAQDPLAQLLASLFGTFGTSRRRDDERAGNVGGGGEGVASSKAERLRQKAAERRIEQFRQQMQSRLEHDILNFELVADRIETLGQRDLDCAERSLDSWARPARIRPGGHAPIDAFSLARVRSAITTTMSSVVQSLADQAARLVRSGEEQIYELLAWFRQEVASVALELGRMRAGHYLPPEREWWDIEQALRSKGEAELKRWREHIAAAEQARLRQFETMEAGLIGRAFADYDLASRADPAKLVSLDMVRVRHGRRGIALFRPFPPPATSRKPRSHFGGLPDLPADVDWPHDELAGPLRFLAQVDLAELPHDIAELPQSGTLLFFAGLGRINAKVPPIVIFDPDSAGSQAAAPEIGFSGDEGMSSQLPGEPELPDGLMPYWPLAGGLVDTIPAPASLDADACFKPEYADYCRAYEGFGKAQVALAAAPMKGSPRHPGPQKPKWPARIFAAHVTGYAWTWRGLGYVAQGLARAFAHFPDVGDSAARWAAEADRHEPDTPLPPAVPAQFAEVVDKAREEEIRIHRRNENVRPNGVRSANERALERLLLDAAADNAIAASLPAALTATLSDTHVAFPAAQILGHPANAYPALDPFGEDVCLLQIFSDPLFCLGAAELRFVMPREALVRQAWEEVRLWVPSRLMG
ncbi:MAG TPA: DUF1963 domain-containing protein [Allosphingosinicella sp.]|jgi:hypothetical protein